MVLCIARYYNIIYICSVLLIFDINIAFFIKNKTDYSEGRQIDCY